MASSEGVVTPHSSAPREFLMLAGDGDDEDRKVALSLLSRCRELSGSLLSKSVSESFAVERASYEETGVGGLDIVALRDALKARADFFDKKFRLVEDAGSLLRDCVFGVRGAAAPPGPARLRMDHAGVCALRKAVEALEHSMRQLDLDAETEVPRGIDFAAIDEAGKAFVGERACWLCFCRCVQFIAVSTYGMVL
jgi:hypothetical protein